MSNVDGSERGKVDSRGRGDASTVMPGVSDAASDSSVGGMGGKAGTDGSGGALARSADAAPLHDAAPIHDASDGEGGSTTPRRKCDPMSHFESVTELSELNGQMFSVQGAFVDATTIYFAGQRVAGDDYDIFASTGNPNTDSFPLAHVVASLSTTNDDVGPILSSDGLTVFFGTLIPGQLYDIYYAKRTSRTEDFGKPELAWNLNTSGYESVDSISPDGQTIYIESTRSGRGDGDIYRSTTGTSGVFGEPTPIEELNSPYDDAGAVISWDGLTVYFATSRDVGDGSFNVWTAHRADTISQFMNLHPLPELNTPGWDTPTSISPDECTLYITRPASGRGYRVLVARRSTVAP